MTFARYCIKALCLTEKNVHAWFLYFRVWTMTTARISCFWRRKGAWVTWWAKSQSKALMGIIGSRHASEHVFKSYVLICAACLAWLNVWLSPAGLQMPGDQSLGHLWSHWGPDWTHSLLHRHRGGAASWCEVSCGQGQYPFVVLHLPFAAHLLHNKHTSHKNWAKTKKSLTVVSHLSRMTRKHPGGTCGIFNGWRNLLNTMPIKGWRR